MINQQCRVRAAWAGLFALNFLGLLPWLFVEFTTVDLAAIVFDALRLQAGYVPYRDTFNHHFVGYLLPFRIVAALAPLTTPTLKIVALLCNFAVAVCVHSLLERIANRRAAWVGALFAVTIGWYWNWQGYALNVQSILAPSLALYLFFLVRSADARSERHLVAAAIVGGAIVTADQRAMVFLPMLIIPVLRLERHRQGQAFLVAAAATVLVPVLCAAYLVAQGAWRDAIRQTLEYPLFYRNRGLTNAVPFWVLWPVYLLLTEPAPVLLGLAGLVACLVMDSRVWLRSVLAMAILSTAVYSAAGGRLFPNYFVLFGVTLIVCASLLPHYLERRSQMIGRAATALIIGLCALHAAKPLLAAMRTGVLFVPGTEREARMAAAFIQQKTSASDQVLVWGFAPQLYVWSGRLRTFQDATLLSITGGNFDSTRSEDQGLLPEMVDRFEEYLRSTPPKAIAYYRLTQPAVGVCAGKGIDLKNSDFTQVQHLAPLRDLLARSYTLERTFDGPCERIEVYLRSDGAPTLERDEQGQTLPR
jgi:hypothetical protein